MAHRAALARDGSVMGVAIGYLAGTIAVGGVPLVVVWRTDRQPWTALVARLLVGVAVAAGIVVAARTSDLSYWYEPLLIVAFPAFWSALSHRDLRAALTLARGSRSADVPPGV